VFVFLVCPGAMCRVNMYACACVCCVCVLSKVLRKEGQLLDSQFLRVSADLASLCPTALFEVGHSKTLLYACFAVICVTNYRETGLKWIIRVSQ